jgi:hypothetical protein
VPNLVACLCRFCIVRLVGLITEVEEVMVEKFDIKKEYKSRIMLAILRGCRDLMKAAEFAGCSMDEAHEAVASINREAVAETGSPAIILGEARTETPTQNADAL